MLYGYLFWWYGAGLKQSAQIALAVIYRIADFFSIESLVKTWFSPWKNDSLSASNAALGDQVKIWEQNFASRFVGFFIRSVIIFFSIICLAFSAILSVASLIVWLTVPALIFILPVVAIWRLGQ